MHGWNLWFPVLTNALVTCHSCFVRCIIVLVTCQLTRWSTHCWHWIHYHTLISMIRMRWLPSKFWTPTYYFNDHRVLGMHSMNDKKILCGKIPAWNRRLYPWLVPEKKNENLFLIFMVDTLASMDPHVLISTSCSSRIPQWNPPVNFSAYISSQLKWDVTCSVSLHKLKAR